MASALRPVVTFLNHGILPFVGRNGEIARIVEFWRETMAEPVLRALLVTAEAGMGKSRMADEIIQRVERQGAAVVQIRFYPDSSLSLAPLLSQALGLSFERQQLPIGESDRSSDIALLRRLAFLRPTMILIEDLHLLSGNSLRELQQMLLALRDLPVSVVLLTRPIEVPVRGVVEPWLVEEIQLSGLDRADLARLLGELFGMTSAEWMQDILHAATLGNPLAIRSALRAAVTSGALVNATDGSWRIAVDRESLAGAIERGVHLLTEGMIAHLSPHEREAAEMLAELGEVFARQTARGLVDDADQAIDTLLFRGILSHLDLPISPLVGTRGDADLLVFSHTLLHRSLLSPGSLPGGRIIAPLAAGLPFYSTHVIEQLARDPGDLDDASIILDATKQLLDAASHIDATADWQVAPRLIDAAEALAAHYATLWDPDTRRSMELQLLQQRLSSMRREDMSEEFRLMAERFLEATAEPLPQGLRHFRIQALKQKHLLHFRRNELSLAESWEQVESLIRLHPELRSTRYYIYYLRFIVTWGLIRMEYAMARIGEQRFAEIEAEGILDDKLHAFARREIHKNLLAVVESPEELERRLEFLAELDASPQTIDNSMASNKIRLLLHTGRIDEVIPFIEEWIPRFEAIGLVRNAVQYRVMMIVEPIAFGDDLDSVARRVREIMATAPEQTRESLRQLALVSLVAKGMLRGEIALAEKFAQELYRPGDDVMEYELRLLVALARGSSSDTGPLRSDRERACATRRLVRYLEDPAGESLEEMIARVRHELTAPIIGTYDLLTTHGLLLLIERLRQIDDGTIEQALRPAIRQGIDIGLQWLAERGMWAYMLPLVQLGKGWLTRREAESWQSRAHGIARDRKMRLDESSRVGVLRIRMLGSIEAHAPDGTVMQIRGGRLRLLLGLLVADRMLARPLGHREFCRIAGGDDDPERARKTMNGAVMRLRETLGEDAILTDGETPALNLDLVDVDLLDTLRLMREAGDAMRARLLARALSAVHEALDIWNGKVPFPTLYQSFFEAAREDFECGMRSTVMTIARALLAEDDPSGAENLLRRTLAILPDDAEIAQLLIATLERAGRKADAERVRMSGEIEKEI